LGYYHISSEHQQSRYVYSSVYVYNKHKQSRCRLFFYVFYHIIVLLDWIIYHGAYQCYKGSQTLLAEQI
jgi:hypothetical protein